MRNNLFHTVFKSVIYYRSSLFYQFLITLFLAAIIAGSLLTGSSVRQTLKNNTENKLNNAGILISSGLRYFDPSLSGKVKEKLNVNCVSIFETKGFSRNFNTGESALNVQVFGVKDDFFSFNPNSTISELKTGEVLINSKLAEQLNIGLGDDIIIRFKSISSIPLNAPFAPDKDPQESLILSVGGIADEDAFANFSLGISQLKPLNVFLKLEDLKDAFEGKLKTNRLLIEANNSISESIVESTLKEVLAIEDIGLQIREIKDLNQYEIISDRIFIDKSTIDVIKNASPKASPIITYLANSIEANGKQAPYSFVSALPENINSEVPKDKGIILNQWLADDLQAKIGDSVNITYYVSENNRLVEEQSTFVVEKIVAIEKQWADTQLMPDFPGISGSESCSNWDAGVAIDLDKIRDKDEDYWNEYKGTPKAFVNYSEGVKIWGNNFGPATALRFSNVAESQIRNELKGQLNPKQLGFSIQDVYAQGISAAKNSVDFSTLFLSLSFFILASAILLLTLLVTSYFDQRKKQIKTLFALGFKNGTIAKMLLIETATVSFLASLIGVFLGIFINDLIIYALNSVWEGAVQTNTLTAYNDYQMLALAFLSTFLIALFVLYIKIKGFLKGINEDKEEANIGRKAKAIQWLFPLSLLMAMIPFIAYLLFPESATMLFFLGGSLVFISLLFFFRWIIFKFSSAENKSSLSLKRYAFLYYSFHPSKALSPIIFIAAGLFIIIITGANRKSFEFDHLSNASGTGGYLIWAETMSPIEEDLNIVSDRFATGLNQEKTVDLSFLQALKLEGDDASCLNLNQIAAPSILGLDSDEITKRQSFSIVNQLNDLDIENPWDALKIPAKNNIIYGIADQTVLTWGLKLAVGDTLSILGESGEPLHIVFVAGIKPSVFQGYILIGKENFLRFMPSISGSSIFLARGNPDKIEIYKQKLQELFGSYGIGIENTQDRLASFYEVTNTYLTVFMTLGGLGMLLGIFGLALIMIKNIDSRKSEYAFLIINGFTRNSLRKMVYKEYGVILLAGMITGTLPAFIATLPSLLTGVEIPWGLLFATLGLIALLGSIIIKLSADRLIKNELIEMIRKD